MATAPSSIRAEGLRGLKGNIGPQNYAIPHDVQVARYRSVVVWCKRFGVPFAAAAL